MRICIGLLLIYILYLLGCYGGSLKIENEYPALYVVLGASDSCTTAMTGSMSGRSLNIDSKTLQYSGKIMIYYGTLETTIPLSFRDNNKKHYPVIDLEKYFEVPGFHKYSTITDIEGSMLEVDFEMDLAYCDETNACFIPEKRIQKCHCKITYVALNGKELPREILMRGERKIEDFFDKMEQSDDYKKFQETRELVNRISRGEYNGVRKDSKRRNE